MENSTIRLNKYLANQGIASRRDIKSLLKYQIVTVNGQRIKESGFRIDPKRDDVRLNGNKIEPPELLYFLLNKPRGIVSTTADEYERKNVISLVPTKERIYPVGRLDKDTTGLIILTNDGALTNLLTHPRFHVDKVYRLTIAGGATNAQLHALRNGVLLTDGITAPAEVTVLSKNQVEMKIHEGRNRQIRRMCETVGIKLVDLQRIKFGPLTLKNLSVGKFRKLTQVEIASLYSQ
jgi:23S rRNA pseudouridine2605 synthase